MALVIRTAKTLKNHWKKSTFAAAIIGYSFSSYKTYIGTQDLMRLYCQKAAKYGKEPLHVNSDPRSVTVILNPNANKRKSTDEFEKYCAPLLYLAGISVEIIKTESEGHAKSLMEHISGTDAIVVAGGDGTLSEVITGLLRRTNENTINLVPLGILPLGKNNTIANTYFSTEKKLNRIQILADATMAVIEQVVKPTDVIKIETLNENSDTPSKPIYAVAGFKWGAYRDAEAKKDSYWYLGPLRKYATYVFNGYKNSLSWNCKAILEYNSPCEGCSNCYKKKQNTHSSSWFQKFIKEDNPKAKYYVLDNPECKTTYKKNITTTDFALLTSNVIPGMAQPNKIPKLQIEIGPGKVTYLDFLKNGWKSENGEQRDVKEIIEARIVKIKPEIQEKDAWFSIDNENYEVKPIKVTLLPKIINMFCKKEDTNI